MLMTLFVWTPTISRGSAAPSSCFWLSSGNYFILKIMLKYPRSGLIMGEWWRKWASNKTLDNSTLWYASLCPMSPIFRVLAPIPSHTPPEEWVRAKKFFITFDTNFGRYLARGTIIDGSLKCRIRAFCTIAKISGEMSKKGLKTGQNGVNFFFNPHTY